jgi:hypothetical protein
MAMPRKPTFAEVVQEVANRPRQPEPDPRGDDWQHITDPSGRRWTLVEEDVSPEVASTLVRSGAALAWDSCGSRGWGAPVAWLTAEDAATLAGSDAPELRRGKRRSASLSRWKDQGGRTLVLAEMSVRWGRLLD